MGLMTRMANKLIKNYMKSGLQKDIEPLIPTYGPAPKAKLTQIRKAIEKYGAEGIVEAIEAGLKHKESGISFKMEITREDIKNDPQFVVNAIQIGHALKALENPEAMVQQSQQPSGIVKKMKDINELIAMTQQGNKQ